MSASRLETPRAAGGFLRQDRPDWERDGKDWPNRDASRFCTAAGMTWHVQILGQGPVALLLHGTGASTHSFGDLAPILAEHFTVVAVDLPGHGFTTQPPRAQMSLPGMAASVAGLLQVLGLKPVLAVGHSAGAAILIRMCLDGLIAPRALVSLNGALWPLQGAASPLFAPLARLFARNPLVPMIFSWHAADPKIVGRLLHGTGSKLTARQAEFYSRLARRSGHAQAALMMMANWDLPPLAADLPKLAVPLLLITGGNDKSIPPSDAARVQAVLPGARHVNLPGLGHLAHEEAPADCAALILEFAANEMVPA
jgi:magnesium chelatase accessory protein